MLPLVDSDVPLVDGRLGASSPSALALLVMGTVFALRVTDIFNVFHLLFVSCFNCPWGCLYYQNRYLTYPMLCVFCF